MKKTSFIRGWLLIPHQGILWALCSFTMGLLSLYSAMLPPITGISTATYQAASAVGTWIAIIGVVVIGKLITKIGAKPVVVVSLFLGALGCFLMPLARSAIAVYLIQVIVQLAPNGFCFLGSPAIIANWFPRKKGWVLGLVTSFNVLSSIALSPLFVKVVSYIGIVNAMWCTGGLFALYAIITLLWLRTTPQECNLLPDNAPISDEELRSLSVSKGEKCPWTNLQILRQPKFIKLCIGYGCQAVGLVGLARCVFSLMTSRGFSPDEAVRISALSGIFMFAYSNITGMLDKKVGNRWLSMCVSLVGIVGLSILRWGPVTFAVCLIGYVMTTPLAGAMNNLMSSHLMDLSTPKYYAAFNTVFMAVYNLFNGSSGYINAWSLNATGGYDLAIVVYIVALILAAILIGTTRNAPLKIVADHLKLGETNTKV